MAIPILETYFEPPVVYAQSHGLDDGWLLLVVWAWILVTSIAGYLVLLAIATATRNALIFIAFLLRRFRIGKRPPETTFLEITFPADSVKSAYATEQL